MVAYDRHCPNCGQALSPLAGDAQSPPWACWSCRRGWWVSELSPEAQLAWRTTEHDHGMPHEEFFQELEVARADERDAALSNGTSLIEEHLPLLSAEELEFWGTYLQIRVDREAEVSIDPQVIEKEIAVRKEGVVEVAAVAAEASFVELG